MGEYLYDINIEISVSVPIIGDESIMLLQPPDGFVFRKYLLDDYKFKSNLVDGAGKLKEDYFFAVHNDSEKYIICLEFEDAIIYQHDKPIRSMAFINGDDFETITEPIHRDLSAQLWRFFAMLHLFKEGEVAQKHAFFTYVAKDGCVTSKINRPSVCADIVTLIRYPMIISPNEIADINAFMNLNEHSYNMLKEIVIGPFEYTYHVLDDATNYTSIITLLEIMFLTNDYGQKKEMLAKRIAVFLGGSSAEILQIYNDVKRHYVDRSNAVHEGIIAQINRASLDELRNLTRKATKKYLSVVEHELATDPAMPFDVIRGNLVASLKSEVLRKIAAGVLPQ